MFDNIQNPRRSHDDDSSQQGKSKAHQLDKDYQGLWTNSSSRLNTIINHPHYMLIVFIIVSLGKFWLDIFAICYLSGTLFSYLGQC